MSLLSSIFRTRPACRNRRKPNKLILFSLGYHRRYILDGGRSLTNVKEVAEYVKEKPVGNVVVMAGAGISTPSGIPDFRTPGTGLYDNLQKYNLPYPEAIFDIDYFHVNPKPFFSLARELYPSRFYRPNAAHYFASLLNQKNMLVQMYTQNIDGLERLAGLPEDKLMEAHGTFSSATCTVCDKQYNGLEIKEDILTRKVPYCRASHCNGVIKPDVVFFGEQLSDSFWLFPTHMERADLVVVMGTSLEVYPFAGIAEAAPPNVPRLLFNRDPAGSFVDNPRKNDAVADGDLIQSLLHFCDLIGWKQELLELMNEKESRRKNEE